MRLAIQCAGLIHQTLLSCSVYAGLREKKTRKKNHRQPHQERAGYHRIR